MVTRSATTKRPFDLGDMFARIREAVRPFPKAAMFELHDDGFTAPFEQLVACIISIRTRDEAMVVMARRLFEKARAPAALAALAVDEIDACIHESAFHEAKSHQIHDIAVRTDRDFGGTPPCDFEVLTS